MDSPEDVHRRDTCEERVYGVEALLRFFDDVLTQPARSIAAHRALDVIDDSDGDVSAWTAQSIVDAIHAPQLSRTESEAYDSRGVGDPLGAYLDDIVPIPASGTALLAAL